MFKITGRRNKAQSILDFVLIFGILVTFIAGLTRIWIWFNANYAKRNVDYQNTRFAAGKANDSHFSSLAYNDQVLTINDDWVFKGQTSGTVGMPPASTTIIDAIIGDGGDQGGEAACASARETATALRQQAANMDDQADTMHNFIRWGDEWYKPLFFVFMALGIDVGEYEDAIDALRAGANDTRAAADELVSGVCG